ncbi:amino acid ABC transporter substrate-binding protein [Shewanella psychropiezotolerans]|uniref:Amino acid ABC transporter substrate-binding protein n=1 Tax=Shewanella psychropiezotolerans TaxID=2593655 RepID=A0ABX5WWA2_9GAMM|nr:MULTISPECIES: transporter substrate-binding domain-containing protein [Shewanella]MPY22631.1 amino acid ABC transporter substrate-binding protein [Shewanella sp. YLB-07]QDO83071.1 amino acid ABC transporter substrate-binding protein [Shewanella psychropiezotolerans]
MIRFICCLILLSISTLVSAEEKMLHADFRHRPPEMIVENNRAAGPLKDVLDEAADVIGYKIEWRIAPFARSLKGLKNGKVDLVPRVIKTSQREKFIDFLGPIGHRQKDIVFLVRKGKEKTINDYHDLYQFEIGIKRDTAYFTKFDDDKALHKILLLDDRNMSSMFAAHRFDVMVVLDKDSIESAFKQIHFTDYAYAHYRHKQNIGIFYGLSKLSANTKVNSKLSKVLLNMSQSGRVAQIYQDYKLKPPLRLF